MRSGKAQNSFLFLLQQGRLPLLSRRQARELLEPGDRLVRSVQGRGEEGVVQWSGLRALRLAPLQVDLQVLQHPVTVGAFSTPREGQPLAELYVGSAVPPVTCSLFLRFFGSTETGLKRRA